MFDLRPVAYVIGLLSCVLGATMLLPLAIDFIDGSSNWTIFLQSSMLTILLGGLTAVASSNSVGSRLSIPQTFLLTTGVWLVLPIFGALPFWFGSLGNGYTDAFFETMSAFTTRPDEGGPFPVVFFYMDAPGKREELHDMARRIARNDSMKTWAHSPRGLAGRLDRAGYATYAGAENLGAGYVSAPVIEYLTRDPSVGVTVAAEYKNDANSLAERSVTQVTVKPIGSSVR